MNVLHEMGMKKSNGEIAKTLQDKFPSRFPELDAALKTVGDITLKFGS